MNTLEQHPCLDSPEMGRQRQRELKIRRSRAAILGMTAVRVAKCGHYINEAQGKVDVSHAVAMACSNKVSIAPDASLPMFTATTYSVTHIQVTNETTLGASRQLHDAGLKPLALNFANGIQPGGGVRLWISDKHWKAGFRGHFRRLYLQLLIGRRNENFLGLFGIYLRRSSLKQ